MNRISRFVSLMIVTVVSGLSCQSPQTQIATLPVAATAAPGTPLSDGERVVDFEGVRFRYDANVFGSVKSEMVPAQNLEARTDKPDSVFPAHIRFTFDLGSEHSKAELSVYPLGEFPHVYSVNPDLVRQIKQEIDGLKKALKDTRYRLDKRIPHLLFLDVSDDFYVNVRHVNFVNGRGIIFITHWTHGADLVSNRNLIYRFEGLTDDEKYYVMAETPLRVKFLPNDSPEEFEGYTYENLFDPRNYSSTRHKTYVKSITDRLEKLGPSEFQPDLEKFESIIGSVKITR